jgi:putative sterol carrier protein
MAQGVMFMEDRMNDELTPGQVIEAMPAYFQPEKAGNTNATIQFDLSGDQAGKWYIKVADGQASATEGQAETPNLTLLADGRDAVKIFTGKMDPTAAFMSGKLKVKGDMGLAMRMQSMFRRPS